MNKAESLVQKINYALIGVFTFYVVLGNIVSFSRFKQEFLSSSLTEAIILSALSLIIALLGLYVIYASLVKMKKFIYGIFLFVSSLGFILFFFKEKTVLTLVGFFLITLPTLIFSAYILGNHKFK